MRYFLNYHDDTMQPITCHRLGELVNRKPLSVSFLSKTNNGKNGRQANATRLGREFAAKLWRPA